MIVSEEERTEGRENAIGRGKRKLILISFKRGGCLVLFGYR